MLITTGATQAVPSGGVSQIVTGSFPSTYGVKITPNWMTGYSVTGKTTTQFTVMFDNPAPTTPAASFWWEVTQP